MLRPVLAGTSKARLAYAPDWMFNLTFKPVLQQLAEKIERGEIARFDGMSEGEAQAQWESNLSDEQRNEVAEWRQYDATRPAINPDADAQRQSNGGNSN